jgi:hypothetical protein
MPEPSNLGAIEERVTGLERAVTHISTSIDALGKEFRERQRFPWAVVLSGIGVLLLIASMFGGIVVWSFNSYLTGINETFDRFHLEFTKLSDSVVPRGEHQGHWEAQVTADAYLQRQLDELDAKFGSAYSLSDAMSQIQDRLSRLEQLRLQQSVEVGP